MQIISETSVFIHFYKWQKLNFAIENMCRWPFKSYLSGCSHLGKVINITRTNMSIRDIQWVFFQMQ